MRWPALALVPALGLALACAPDAPPDAWGLGPVGVTADESWRAAVSLPAAAEACRQAGYPAHEIEAVVEGAEDAGLTPADLSEALFATARAAQAYGPVGDLSGYLAEALHRNTVSGPPLVRMIQAHHATYGSNRMSIPPVQDTTPTPSPQQPAGEGEPAGRGPGGGV